MIWITEASVSVIYRIPLFSSLQKLLIDSCQVFAAAAMFAVVIGLGGSAYAMDIGGIQRTVQVWIHGDQTDAMLVAENGSYSLDYEDEDGKLVHRGGSGVAINPEGTERPLTEEELWDEINAPEVEYEEDGRVVVYYLNQQDDVTDEFVDGVCYVRLQVKDSVFT